MDFFVCLISCRIILDDVRFRMGEIRADVSNQDRPFRAGLDPAALSLEDGQYEMLLLCGGAF